MNNTVMMAKILANQNGLQLTFFILQELSEKSITLLGPDSVADVSIEKVENVNIVGRAVSASKPGNC